MGRSDRAAERCPRYGVWKLRGRACSLCDCAARPVDAEGAALSRLSDVRPPVQVEVAGRGLVPAGGIV